MLYVIAAKALLDFTVCLLALASGQTSNAVLFLGFAVADVCSMAVVR